MFPMFLSSDRNLAPHGRAAREWDYGRMAIANGGRPRLVTKQRPGDTVRDEILDAAAELFTTGGFASTSTRMIATAVGLRQASLYHYISTKDEILDMLLSGTVDDALTFAEGLSDRTEPAAARMYALVFFDARQLAATRWNLGALYFLPELRAERFAEFRAKRARLMAVYAEIATETMAELGTSVVPSRAELPFRMVESVINIRADSTDGRGAVDDDYPDVLAEAALRALGWTDDTASVRGLRPS